MKELESKVRLAIVARRQAWQASLNTHRLRMLEEVATLLWLQSGQPEEFHIVHFEGIRGKVFCKMSKHKRPGERRIKVYQGGNIYADFRIQKVLTRCEPVRKAGSGRNK